MELSVSSCVRLAQMVVRSCPSPGGNLRGRHGVAFSYERFSRNLRIGRRRIGGRPNTQGDGHSVSAEKVQRCIGRLG